MTIQIITPSSFSFETYCAGNDTEGAEQARFELEKKCLEAIANDHLNPRYYPDEEIESQEAEDEMFRALDEALKKEIEAQVIQEVMNLDDLFSDNAVLVDLASFPLKRDLTRQNTQTSSCTTTQSARRQGRGHKNKAKGSKMVDERLARLYDKEEEFDRITKTKAIWEDSFKPADLEILYRGYDDCSGCYFDLDPEVYLFTFAMKLRGLA